jgi:CRISPR system Cascade subunit CasD
MSGLLLRLAAPLQSWGEHSTFTQRDTVRFPTRSGLIGLLACVEGHPRGEPLTRYDTLGFTVRIDRPGTVITDYHTIGGGYPRDATVPTAEGKRRSSATATIVSRRLYLADAVFCVAITATAERVAELALALNSPRWQPYLGRRSCPPDQPLLLRTCADPVADLYARVPIAIPRRTHDPVDVEVDFVYENEPSSSTTVAVLADVPTSFGRRHRGYRTRTVHIAPRAIPAEICVRTGVTYHEALHAYATREAT